MRPPSGSLYKKLLDHIHPQLPLSVRDSNRLLGVLKSTFHKQLDLEHPFPANSNSNSKNSFSSIYSNSSNNPATPRFIEVGGERYLRPDSAGVSSHVSASQHLDTILAHPLFGGPTRRHSLTLQTTHLEECIQAREKFEKDAVTRVASIESAIRLLFTVLDHASALNDYKKARNFVKETKVTHCVLHWLRATHNLTSSAIKKNQVLFEALVKGLVAEGRHGLVERWIFTTLSTDQQQDQGSKPLIDSSSRRWLLDILLRIETQWVGLEASVARFSYRLENLKAYFAQSQLSADEELYIVQPALTTLTQSLADAKNGLVVGHELYDKLIIALGKPGVESPYMVHLARLQLYHPTQPDATSMLSLLQILESAPTSTLTPTEDEPWQAQLKTLVQWALDASKLLSRQGDAEPADRALRFAKRMCAAAQVDWNQLLQGREPPLRPAE